MEWVTFGQGEKMKNNLFINKIYICFFIILTFIILVFNVLLFSFTKNISIAFLGVIFSVLIILLIIVLLTVIRRKIIIFFNILNSSFDNIIYSEKNDFSLEEETLISKFNFKLKRLYEILNNNREEVKEEKESIQEIISDISHQVKTPIANLKIYNSTLLEREIPLNKQKEFHSLMETQINKLDFLMDSMVKVSRLEAGMINLKISDELLYETIAKSLSSIILQAEKKSVEVYVECDSSIKVQHDRKWTAEALFNILDNAIKYSKEGGKILIKAHDWESLVKVDIEDNGHGIEEKEFAQIFKRFYRGENVNDVDGVGIGLYLCREIISKQSGYIKVKSKVGVGSTFTVFLPKKRVIAK